MEQNQQSQTQPAVQTPANFWKMIGIGMAIVSFLTALGVIGFLLSSKKRTVKTFVQSPAVSSPSTTPFPFLNWPAFTTPDYVFQIPPDYKIEQQENNLYTVMQGSSQVMTVDAKLNGDNADFNKSVALAQSQIQNSTLQTISNGMVVSGDSKIGLVRYRDGAVVVKLVDKTISDAVFNQILSTFKFTDQKK